MTVHAACAWHRHGLSASAGSESSYWRSTLACRCPATSEPVSTELTELHVPTQDFMKAAQCAMYEFTDLGWWELDATGANPGPRQEGFVWHTDPGCILLPEDTRICFIRCDTADCVQKQVSSIRTQPHFPDHHLCGGLPLQPTKDGRQVGMY